MKIIARAKVNLFLQITGKREDGYHLLNSLFAFTEFGDEITIQPADSLKLTIDGPYASCLSDTSLENNLSFRAGLLLKNHMGIQHGAHIHLTKNIPVAAGLGGGSADAAAVLRGLNTVWGLQLNEKELLSIGLKLGADVPACLYQKTAFITGVGENIHPITLSFNPMTILLVNPKIALNTATVFQYYQQSLPTFSSSLHPDQLTVHQSPSAFYTLLAQLRNDLEPIAATLLTEVADLLLFLKEQPNCLLSRMSGSGPTCFALFDDFTSSEFALSQLKARYPEYWYMITRIDW